ncbi:hypothetical protein BCR42DRAFT_409901 [Absidia repens]|uniref:Uncharacterized protein n=1 Tax=Absidia repens TaxID=90262 RepID=A0A1X2INA0_9FUNG|nr:hypothetical protein BCR42DRAFT_409901 [Absidia repens]
MDRNKQTHSTDLLNIPGKNKTLAKLLSDQNSTLQQPQQDEDTTMIPPPELRKTFKINPNNDILSRVQSFLPQLQAANQQLDAVDPAKLDIENVDEDSEQYIEMNLGLGVYDTKPTTTTSDDGDDDNDSDDNDANIVIPSSNNKGPKPSIEFVDK